MLDENQLYAVCRYAIIHYFAKNVGNDKVDTLPIHLSPTDFTSVMDFLKRNYQAYIKSKDLNYRKDI